MRYDMYLVASNLQYHILCFVSLSFLQDKKLVILYTLEQGLNGIRFYLFYNCFPQYILSYKLLFNSPKRD